MARMGEEEVVNAYGDGTAWIRVSMIGKGSFGRVFLATLRNPTSRNGFFPPVMAVKSAEVSSSASIQKEREIYSSMGWCPYIIHCYGDEMTIGRNGTMAYNMMLEYGAGGTLADRIEESGGGKRLAELEARLHSRSILRGLRHIHELGYVHCDLKPDNILLVPHSGVCGLRAKIGDLGLAKKVRQSRKRKLGFGWEGTPMYLSPEAVVDNVQEAAADVWAVGCIVFEMLTGKSPLEGKGEELGALEILREIGEGNERVEIPNELSKEAKAFLKGCFVRNPKFRLTCEMLLQHPFLDGLDEDEESESECDDDDEEISSDYGYEDDDDGEVAVSDFGEEKAAAHHHQVVGLGLNYPISLTIPAGV